MTELYITLGIILVLAVIIFLSERFKNKGMSIFLKVLSLVFFAFYFYCLFQHDAYVDISNMTGFGSGEYYDPNGSFLSVAELIWINILKWLTSVCVIIVTLLPWIKVNTIKWLAQFFVPIVVVLNIIFFRLNMLANLGPGYSLTDTYSIMFAFEIGLMGVISGYYIYRKFKEKEFDNLGTQFKYMGLILPLLLLSVFPEAMLYNFFGVAGGEAEGFTLTHRIYIYIAFLAPVLLTVFFKKTSYETRNMVLCWLALAGFMQYFFTYTFNFTASGLPFHLCNTAILLMVIAFFFKCKPVFYFTYFVNVIGALFAILLPNTTTEITTISSVHFWFNHWYAFFVPILGITLKIFPRPNFKMIRGAIYIFTIYLLAMVFLNGILNAYGHKVDYFFLYENFIVGKFEFLRPLKDNFVLTFTMGGDHIVKIFWLYNLIVYVAYIFMMFITWIIYAYCYKISDHYAQLRELNKVDVLGIRELKKRMYNRPITEPLYLEEKNMIKFSHFSKRYGNSPNFSVKDFNLEVKEGEVFGFLGHNGSGKSTTIKSLVGIQSLTEGTINVCGYDIEKQPLQAKMQMGYVSDNHAVYEHLTGREYINYVADLYNVSEQNRTERMDKYAEMFNLKDALDREIKGYSHGMKQKVMVISSLIHNPKVWVLDEPLTGLDPTSSYQIKKCMREHANKGNIVFFSSHVIEVVEKVCDRIAIIKKGELQGVYALKDLDKQKISLEELYLDNSELAEMRAEEKKKKESAKNSKTKTKRELLDMNDAVAFSENKIDTKEREQNENSNLSPNNDKSQQTNETKKVRKNKKN